MCKWSNVCVRCLLVCLILLTYTKDFVDSLELGSPAVDFSRHTLVRPILHHARTKREIETTKQTSGMHHPAVTLTVDVDNQNYVLDLRLNEDLVAGDHVISYQKDGKTVLHRPIKEDLEVCQYHGTVRGRPASWAAISTCHGVRGVIYDGENMKYIEPSHDNSIDSDHYIYDHADLNTSFHCGYAGGVTNNSKYDEHLMRRYETQKSAQKSRPSRYKRQAFEDAEVRGPFNANKLSRYVELVLVADNREFRSNGDSISLIHHRFKDVANIINSVYAPLNIFIALVGIVVWNERDEIILEEDGDRTLTNFLKYRREVLSTNIPNDNAHLLTRQKFKDGVVGKALKGPICTYQFSGGVATNHSEVIGLVATTIAHEMGHNFGMEHDTDADCECPDEKCIMSPSSTSITPTHWSSCSLRSLALSFERGMDYCLRNKPKRLYDSPTCGNGFVEAGEECDCGLHPSAACASCCHHDTCSLRSNATCAVGECCDTQTCRPKTAGTVCRTADKECDLPEYCTGYSEYCPKDVYKMDATPCSNNRAYCVRGSCRSHTDQCRLLWGSTGESSDGRCYTSTNVKGDKNGNCGYKRGEKPLFYKCAPADVMCGLLQCRHLNERLEFGMESVSQLSALFINNNGTIIPCRTTMIDLGLSDVDPGMVPDGAKCGEEKMCLNARCVDISSVVDAISRRETSVCPSNCSGHGVCNSEGHCHCETGFSPPLCALPGPGGSDDSGPASDSSIQRNFMVAMYVIFLGILPSILLVMFLLYYMKYDVLFWWKRPRKTMPSPKKSSLQRRISRSASKFASNFQNNNPGNGQAVSVHTLSNPDDMSSSLLRSDSDHSPAGNVNPSVTFFGNFKGFTLTPIDKNTQNDTDDSKSSDVTKSAKITPVHRSGSNSQIVGVKPLLRSAPPLPVVPNTVKTSPKTSPSIKRTNSSVQNRIKALMSSDRTEDVAAVSNSAPRPIISSPILEASTCTAKELISPLQGSKTLGPIRAAPTVPNMTPELPKRPLSMHSGNVLQKPLPEEPKKVKEGISLNRIASFLKPDKPKDKERKPVERSHSLPKNANHQVKTAKAMDKVALRNLQISNPILQKEIDLPIGTVSVVSDSEDNDDPKSFMNRAQSMRVPSQKPTLQTFASMRQAPGVPRPLSGVGRPTAPPPPLPNNSAEKETSIYQSPKQQKEIKSTDYVDCIEEKAAPLAHIDEESSDNIYAIIEESPEKHSKAFPLPIKTVPQEPPVGYNTPKNITSGSTESIGLLGEIVGEIQNRNFDSIYSTSTLARKKREAAKNAEINRDSTNSDYKTPESVYSNSGAKSSASTTSSGYLHPSAVNVPTRMQKDEPKQDIEKPPSPSLKANSKIPTFTRQVTPPGLRSTTSFKNVPPSPKAVTKNVNARTISNSPDVVSSCAVADIKNIKAPDIINNNNPIEPPKVANKPNINFNKQSDNRPPLKPTPVEKKSTTNKTVLKPVNSATNLNKSTEKITLNRTNSKTDSNVKAIADNLNKNRPKVVPKPSSLVQRSDSNAKTNVTKITSKPSNVASLQQKFENRKSFGKELNTAKK